MTSSLVGSEMCIRDSLTPTPSKREVEEHEAFGHAAYRTWCAHCVAAKGSCLLYTSPSPRDSTSS
eukprot:10986231-Prorocentrum_lima.AAC.1